jgi:hypothetical protein
MNNEWIAASTDPHVAVGSTHTNSSGKERNPSGCNYPALNMLYSARHQVVGG